MRNETTYTRSKSSYHHSVFLQCTDSTSDTYRHALTIAINWRVCRVTLFNVIDHLMPKSEPFFFFISTYDTSLYLCKNKNAIVKPETNALIQGLTARRVHVQFIKKQMEQNLPLDLPFGIHFGQHLSFNDNNCTQHNTVDLSPFPVNT